MRYFSIYLGHLQFLSIKFCNYFIGGYTHYFVFDTFAKICLKMLF